MAKKFAEHNGLNLTQTNNDVLAAWEKNDIFHKSIDEREGCPQFIFFEGPPSANGHPGCLLYTSPSPRDGLLSRMPSSA